MEGPHLLPETTIMAEEILVEIECLSFGDIWSVNLPDKRVIEFHSFPSAKAFCQRHNFKYVVVESLWDLEYDEWHQCDGEGSEWGIS